MALEQDYSEGAQYFHLQLSSYHRSLLLKMKTLFFALIFKQQGLSAIGHLSGPRTRYLWGDTLFLFAIKIVDTIEVIFYQ